MTSKLHATVHTKQLLREIYRQYDKTSVTHIASLTTVPLPDGKKWAWIL